MATSNPLKITGVPGVTYSNYGPTPIRLYLEDFLPDRIFWTVYVDEDTMHPEWMQGIPPLEIRGEATALADARAAARKAAEKLLEQYKTTVAKYGAKELIRIQEETQELRGYLKTTKAWKSQDLVAKAPAKKTAKKSPTKKTAKKTAKKSPTKKSPTKKSPTKKSPAKKSPAKKSPAKKSPAKKSPTKKSPVKGKKARAKKAAKK